MPHQSSTEQPRRALDVQTYEHLTHPDIHALTNLLLPSRNHQPLQTSHLPPHLRASIPLLTTSCSKHNKLNPLPLRSILSALKSVVENDVPRMDHVIREYDARRGLERGGMVRLLQDLSAVWLRRGEFEGRYGRLPPAGAAAVTTHGLLGGKKRSQCAVCGLMAIGENLDALIALGGCLIGRIRTKKWQGSLRVLWIEEWIRALAFDDPKCEGRDVVGEMWALGAELRRLRKGGRIEAGGVRGHVEELVREMQFVERVGDERPLRMPGQGDHVAFVRAAMADDERSPRGCITEADTQSMDGEAPGEGSAPRTPSSLRAHNAAECEDDGSTPPTSPPESTPSGLSVQRNQVHSLAQHSRYRAGVQERLQPVPIPKRYENQNSWQTQREIQKRVAASQHPALRTGSNGQIKGPYDNLSQASLISRERTDLT